MSEFHGEISKDELYRMEKLRINQEYDQKMLKKSWFDSKSEIERQRQNAINDNKARFYGNVGGRFIE